MIRKLEDARMLEVLPYIDHSYARMLEFFATAPKALLVRRAVKGGNERSQKWRHWSFDKKINKFV